MYWQLLLYGVHVGHSFLNSVIFSAWFVYTFRQNILIINLFKTLLMLKNGYVGLSGACHFGGPIWFINLHRAVELYVNYSAKQCGEFCYTTYWIYGLISNWLTLANTFKKLGRMAKTANKGQFAKLEFGTNPWIMGRFSWPRATFVSSVSTSPHPTKESLYLGIPCLGLVDTDVSGHIANIAIPGNDDSLDCMVFYNTHISQYILEKKYSNISGWFFHTRRHKRVITFLDWIFNNYISKDGVFDKARVLWEEKKRHSNDYIIRSYVKYKVPYNTIWTYGLEFFFSRNHGLDNYKEQVDLYEQNKLNVDIDINHLLLKHRRVSVYVSKVINYYILKASWRFGRFLKKYLFRRQWFKRRFLVGFYEKYVHWDITDSKNYMKARFYVNRVYKTHLRRNKWRFNKFMLKFFKFYISAKYLEVRGFFKPANMNFMCATGFARVAESFGSTHFTELFYPHLIKTSMTLSKFRREKKKDMWIKWHFFKKAVTRKVNGMLSDDRLSIESKTRLKWRVSQTFNRVLSRKMRRFYLHYMAFFNFYMWNRAEREHNLREYNSYCYKEWKVLKNMQRNYIYLDFLRKARVSFKRFRDYAQGLSLSNDSIIYYFKILVRNYRKAFFLNINNSKVERLFRLRGYFQKIAKMNVKKRKWMHRKVSMSRYIKKYLYKGKYLKKKVPHSRTIRIYYKARKSDRYLIRYEGDPRFRYKLNKYLLHEGKNHKFAKFNWFLTQMNMSNCSVAMRRAKYYYKRRFGKIDLQFIGMPGVTPGLMFSSKKNRAEANELAPIKLNQYIKFITDYSMSMYSLSSLSYRYYYPYFFRWRDMKSLRSKQKAEFKWLEENMEYLNKYTNFLIKKSLTYFRLKARSRKIAARHKIAMKGVLNYLVVGDKELPTLFIHQHWAYSKQIFGYPLFFHLVPGWTSPMYWEKTQIEIGRKKEHTFKHLFFFLKAISIFNKYFTTKQKSYSIAQTYQYHKYDLNHKRMYWC